MRSALALVVLLLAAAAARAEDCPAAQLATYLKPATLPAGPDTRCDLDAKGACARLELRGFLYAPVGAKGPAPIIVFNHGSGPLPGTACELATYFSRRGYLVFVPHRRGVGKSTGVAPDEYNRRFCSKKGDAGFCKMEYLRLQVDDVAAGVAFAKAQAGVDPARLVLMGHSFGGIVTVMANARDLGQRAAVDFAGGSQSWEANPSAVAALTDDVAKGVAPLFLVEPMNDHSIAPTIELARAAGRACRVVQSLLYPAIDVTGDGKVDAADYDGDVRDKAHGAAMREADAWGPAVEEFAARYLAHPAPAMDKLCQGTSLVVH